MTDWWRFETKEKAEAALKVINDNSKFPITGINAATRLPAPDKQKTERWAEITECIDGKFGFESVNTKMYDTLEISVSEQTAFVTTHKPAVEEYDPAWFPQEEME